MRFVFHYLYPRDLYVGYKNEKKTQKQTNKKNKQKNKTKEQQHMHCFMSKMVFKRMLNKSVFFLTTSTTFTHSVLLYV